jgi:hypothetical protein
MVSNLNEQKQLTQEQARVASEKFLWDSKMWERHSFKLVEEYFWNDDKALTNAKCTTIVLNKGGDDFFVAHLEDRERYQRLVDKYADFIHRTVIKARQVGLTKQADRLDQNKDRFKQYLVKQNWT